MKISDELKEKIVDLLKDNTELRDRVLAGDRKAIQEISNKGENIPLKYIIKAYENGCMEDIYKLAKKKDAYRDLYFELCKSYSKDRIQEQEQER